MRTTHRAHLTLLDIMPLTIFEEERSVFLPFCVRVVIANVFISGKLNFYVAINPLNPNGNLRSHLLQQSLTQHFLVMCLV